MTCVQDWPVTPQQKRCLSQYGHPDSWQVFVHSGDEPWMAMLVRGSTVFWALFTHYGEDIPGADLPSVLIMDRRAYGDAMSMRREIVGRLDGFRPITFPAWAVSIKGARRPGAE